MVDITRNILETKLANNRGGLILGKLMFDKNYFVFALYNEVNTNKRLALLYVEDCKIKAVPSNLLG